MHLNNLRLGQRLGLGFGVVLALLAAIVALSVFQLQRSGASVGLMRDYQERAEAASAWSAKTYLNISRAVAIAKAAGQPEMEAYFAPLVKQTSAEISELQKLLQERVTSEQGKAMLATIAERRDAYLAERKQVFELLKKADAVAADSALKERMLPTSQRYVEAMAALQAFQARMADEHVAEAAREIERARLALLGLLAAALAAGGLIAWAITRSVTRPLQEAVGVAQVIAGSDLSREIRSERRDELGDLLRALGHMQGALRSLVGQVRSATDSMGTASAEIATGNHDLSARTEQTAANLQEAASSMEQLTSTVQQSAESARQANQLASSAAAVATRGGEVVSQVVATMDEINASSKRIADIIGVIDGIAFQTNILALNAAVE
ncbi:methyl-accepting chemotaxis protein, partial [Piscinibacter sakaiensis]